MPREGVAQTAFPRGWRFSALSRGSWESVPLLGVTLLGTDNGYDFLDAATLLGDLGAELDRRNKGATDVLLQHYEGTARHQKGCNSPSAHEQAEASSSARAAARANT